MPIKIKHTRGLLTGKEQTFDDEAERIVVGRDPSVCDVVYPADLTIVGREHLALQRQLSGDYGIEIFGDHFVGIDDGPAQNGQSVASGTVLTLGGDAGPAFALEIDRSQVSALLPRTIPQRHPASVGQVAKRATRFSIVAVAVAVLASAGFLLATIRSNQDEAERLGIASAITELAETQRREAAERISQADRQRLARSVYAVLIRDGAGSERLLGTAWAVGPHLLATNAHVAEERGRLKEGEWMIVRPAGAGDEHSTVTQVAIHPGYGALAQFLDSDPFFVRALGGSERFSHVPGYDVALLQVADELPADVIFEVASPGELAVMAPGDAVASAGYAYENIVGSEVQSLGRTPQVQIGTIVAMTDYFALPANATQRHLIQHSIPATGGASGSPILNANGNVVGLLSAGNIFVVDGRRIPNAALVNYGQRADVLVDLAEHREVERLLADQPYWKAQTAAFERGIDVVIPDYLSRISPFPGAKPVQASSLDEVSSKTDRIGRQDVNGKPVTIRMKTFSFSAKAGSSHSYVAYARGGFPIAALTISLNGKILKRDAGSGDPYAGSTVAFDSDSRSTVTIETIDDDVSYSVRDYEWQPSKP